MSTSVSLTEPFLDVASIAELLGVNHRTVRAWIAEGRLRAVRVGAQIRVEPAALREFLANNTMDGGDAS